MADNYNNTERSNNGMAFVVGGLVVAVLVIGYFVLGGDLGLRDDVNVDVNVPAPTVPEATPPATEPATPPASGTTTN
ncbi:MAG TPA: hypothetical protein VH835_05730 [Dongiaceae bacterium]